MNRSIALAGVALAGFFGVISAHAAEPAAPNGASPMCQEVTYKEYTRPNYGPPGKLTEVVKVTKRTRLVCNGEDKMAKPMRTAAVMHHYKSA